MKILVISQYYYPEPFQKLKDLCEGFASAGHEVVVLTGLPNYPSGDIDPEYRRGKRRQETINGVQVVRVPLVPRKKSKIGLALNYFSWPLMATLKMIFWKERFDIVFCYQTSPVLMLFPAWVAKLKNHCKLVGYCLDLWPDSLLTLLRDKNSYIYRSMHRVSGWLYRRCDALAVTSEPFLRYLKKEHHVDESNLFYIPQHGNDDYLTQNFKKKTVDTIRLLFTGNMGKAQDLETILGAAQQVRKDIDFVIDFVGSGSALSACEAFAKKQGLENRVRFHGRKPYAELPTFYRQADACLVTLRHDNAIGLTLPGKMQDYLAVGKTIIGAIDGAGAQVIQEAQCGFCVKAGDSKALAKVIENFIDNRLQYNVCGENARRYYLNHFTKKKVLGQFLDIFSENKGK